MNAIKTSAVITSLRSKLDKSASLAISTPELSPGEFTAIRELQGVNIDMVISPHDITETGVVSVEGKGGKQKSQSQRYREVLYVLWSRYSQNVDDTKAQREALFDDFYRRRTEADIERVKSEIDGFE